MERIIFIAHTSEDATPAGQLKNSLSKIIEFKPYIAVDYAIYGRNFKERIKQAIEDSNYFVVMLTKDGVRSQWVNQELGYACAIMKKKRDFHIIPISSSDINLKGFITKDSDDLLLLDKYSNDYAFIVAEIVNFIRNTIPNGEREGILTFKYTCPDCLDNKGFPLENFGKIPSFDDISRFYESGNYLGIYPCRGCGRDISINLLTFEQSYNRIINDPFVRRPFKLRPFR